MFLAGLMVQAGLSMITVKLILILIFILFTSPTSTYALANAMYGGGVRPIGRDGRHCETIDKRDDSSKP
jgi:multicomponent Na+:H+ antiporter subunit G